MMSLKVIDTDIFLDMPLSAQALYFHLIARADDDGFLGNPKKIMRMINCSEDDFKILLSKQFIIPFETGICVITHWKIHNLIRSDRYTETIYKNEKAIIEEDHNKAYITNVIPNGNHLEPQGRVVKGSVDKVKDIKHKYGEYNHVLLTDKQYNDLQGKIEDREKWIKIVDESIEEKGNIYKIKNFYLAILKWSKRDLTNKPAKKIFTDFDDEGITL